MRTHRTAGFTLLEVMVALAIASLVLVGLNFFVFSMGELWGRGSEKRAFDQHVTAVTRYLTNELSVAAMPPAKKAGQAAFTVQEVKPSGGVTDNLLTYELLEPDRMFNWADRPLPEVICHFLVREGKGLFLLYHSRLETNFADESPREVLVTPFVTSMTYVYYDKELKRWTTEKTFKKGDNNAWLAPQRLVLTFAYHGLSREVVLTLPVAVQGVPHP